MADVTVIETQAMKIGRKIGEEVEAIRAVDPLTLPPVDHPIVAQFVAKIEGSYDVSRAKIDTDNAVDLLYIAYNATPQSAGEIRVKISGIMDRLITSQQHSERTMSYAMRVAGGVLSALKDVLPDWLDVKNASDSARGIKDFIKSDLIDLTSQIKNKAIDIKEKLTAIAESYDRIIEDAAAATRDSERALASQLADQAAIEKDIVAAEADRDRLDSLVRDLQLTAAKFEASARDYAQRAETAEERAFVMSIVKIGADMLAAAIPPLAMAAGTGGTSVLASSAMNSLAQSQAPKGQGTASGADTTSQAIKAKADISKKQMETDFAKKEVDEGKGKVKELRSTLRKALPAADGRTGGGDAPVPGEDEDKADDSGEVKGIKERLKDAKTNLKASEDKYQGLAAALAGLQAGLSALSQGLGELSQEQKDQAASLREIQMKMLDKAEAYETERRSQAAELVKITALLRGKRTEEETIKLTIKSLNISVSALRRAREIVQEMAFFFKSFADFLDMVSIEADVQLDVLERNADKERIGAAALARLVQSTDEFFIKQGAEWCAAIVVTQKFKACFADGWSKLNKLSGTYITGDELSAYLVGAAVKLTEISDAREAAAKKKIQDIETYRDLLVRGGLDGAAAAA